MFVISNSFKMLFVLFRELSRNNAPLNQIDADRLKFSHMRGYRRKVAKSLKNEVPNMLGLKKGKRILKMGIK